MNLKFPIIQLTFNLIFKSNCQKNTYGRNLMQICSYIWIKVKKITVKKERELSDDNKNGFSVLIFIIVKICDHLIKLPYHLL